MTEGLALLLVGPHRGLLIFPNYILSENRQLLGEVLTFHCQTQSLL
jgi:hypothetical protein